MLDQSSLFEGDILLAAPIARPFKIEEARDLIGKRRHAL